MPLRACGSIGRRLARLAGTGILLTLALLVPPLSAHAADCRGEAEPGRDWSGCNRRNLMISGADLTGADLHEADLSASDMRNVKLQRANLGDAKLARTSLAGAVADEADFGRVEGYRTSLAGLRALNASFKSAELQRSDFTGAVLTGSHFDKAELGRATFEGAHLGNNSFAFANLARANLKKTAIEGPVDFSGAYLFLTRIEGTDLSASTGLTQAQIDLACGNNETRLPAGLNASPNWPCKFD